MYTIKITNHFSSPIQIQSAHAGTVNPGDTQSHREGANDMALEMSWLGTALFLYLGEKTIPKFDLPGKYGVLVRYKGSEFYYRFDGEGLWNVTLDALGTLHFGVENGVAMTIKIPEIVFEPKK